MRAATSGVAVIFVALALAAAVLAATAAAAARRQLAEYAPANCQAYTIQGFCVEETGMEVSGGDYRKFTDTCSWSPDAVEIAEDVLKCAQKAAKCSLKAGPKAGLVCAAACGAFKSLKECVFSDCYNKCKSGGNGGSSGGSSGGGGFCFPGSAVVATADGALKSMRQLAIGDQVLGIGPDGRTTFSKVFTFMTRYPHYTTTFLRVSTDAGVNITLTPDHYLFSLPASQLLEQPAAASVSESEAGTVVSAFTSLTTWHYTLPGDLDVGDAVPVVLAGSNTGAAREGQPMVVARVTGVSEVRDTGIYMPLTAAASIVVDGVVASQMGAVMPKWFANHRVAAAAIRGLGSVMAALPSPARQTVAGKMPDAMHWFMSGQFSLASVAHAKI